MLADIIVPPLIVFLVVVAPIWIVFHYRSKKQVSQGLSESEYQQLNELAQLADSMSERIQTLESLLDAENPEWRNR